MVISRQNSERSLGIGALKRSKNLATHKMSHHTRIENLNLVAVTATVLEAHNANREKIPRSER